MKRIILAVACAAVASTAGAAHADVKRYAVVVAHGEDVKRDVPPLQYADDDGARYYELFSQVADRVELYTVLDADSQRLFPEAARRARVPRRAELLAGLGRTFEAIERDVAAGDSVELYFVLIGHGDIGAGGEGYVSLLDAPFTRTDLFQEVLARSPATTNHVIVDACNSYFMVHRRGGDEGDSGPSRADAVRSFMAREELARYPNTGFLLSTSSERESHEWSEYGAGVFSHQVRSALSGAADVNGDGRIEYSEIEAFVAAANLQVSDPKARVDIHAQAPAIDTSRPLVDLDATRFQHWVRLPAGQPLRVYLEDARGVRYLDVHTSGERDTVLGLVPSSHYYVRSSDEQREARLALARPGRVDFDPGAMSRPTIAARGAVAEAFRRHLYAEPYGPGFYRGFAASRGDRVAPGVDRSWLPAAARPEVIDAAFARARLDEVENLAARDPLLRAALRGVASDILRALDERRFADAVELLARAAAR
jgi:hypothetical protein